MATPMMQQFNRIKQQHPECVIFFRMGDFFEMFLDDAVKGHQVLGLTLTRRAHGKGETADVPLAGFPHHKLESNLAKMTRAGVRVVVVEQVEDPKKAKGLVKRDIVQIVTAGTSLSDDASTGQNQYLVGLVNSTVGRYGISVCDATTGEFTATSLSSTDIRDILDLLNPAEVIFPEDQRDDLSDLIPTGTMRTQIPSWIFEPTFAHDTITSHFKVEGLKGFGLEDDVPAYQAAGAILHYIKENLRTDPHHIRSLSRLPHDKFLVIDSATRRNLEIFEPVWGADKSSTLLNHIDFTITTFGRRRFVQNLLRPLVDIKAINNRLDAIENLFKENHTRKSIRKELRQLGDLERLLARLAAMRGTPRDMGVLRDTLDKIPTFKKLLSEIQARSLKQAAKKLNPVKDLVKFLGQALVDEPPATLLHGGAVRDGYNRRLDDVRGIARGGKDYILSRQEEERKSTGISSLSIKYNKVFGYYIEVSKPNLDKVPDYYIRKQTLVNAERFITPELKEWEEKIVNAEGEMLELERELFEEIRLRILDFTDQVQSNAQILADLDVYSAAAELGVSNKYVRPEIRKDGRIVLVRSRHPVIEKLLPVGETFVPNDLDMDGKNNQIYLVTGPNMGGKSTYLRQVGLIVLMAQTGLFVPAEKAEIPVTDRIFTRVGASDNLAAGESTFLVEMHEAANILHNATNKSLVLLDEIGRGTSTFDGLSLAWAIVEYMHDFPGGLKPKTLFATHYHELTELETTLQRLKNFHVEVKEWGEKVVFLRKVVPGKSGASYGIHVAQLAGLPNPVIERAREVLAVLEASEFTEENIPRLAKDSGARNIPPPREDPLQMTLFTVEERAVRDKLAELDLDNMTPLEAIRVLAEWKEKFGTKE